MAHSGSIAVRAVSMGARVNFRLRRTGAGAALRNSAVQGIRS